MDLTERKQVRSLIKYIVLSCLFPSFLPSFFLLLIYLSPFPFYILFLSALLVLFSFREFDEPKSRSTVFGRSSIESIRRYLFFYIFAEDGDFVIFVLTNTFFYFLGLSDVSRDFVMCARIFCTCLCSLSLPLSRLFPSLSLPSLLTTGEKSDHGFTKHDPRFSLQARRIFYFIFFFLFFVFSFSLYIKSSKARA